MEEFYKFQRLSLNNLGCRSTDDRLNRNDTVYIIYVYVFRVARASTPGWVKLSGSSKRIAPNTTRSLTRWDPLTEKLLAQVNPSLNFVMLTKYWRNLCCSIITVKRNSNKLRRIGVRTLGSSLRRFSNLWFLSRVEVR